MKLKMVKIIIVLMIIAFGCIICKLVGLFNLDSFMCPKSSLKLGDYVILVPDAKTYKISSSSSGYLKDQTIKPSELTLWRVINNNHCNFELVSEYVSSDSVYFKGTTGFANYVGTLNKLSKAYGNKYVKKTRIVGYNGQTEYIKNTKAFDGSSNEAPFDAHTPMPDFRSMKEYDQGVLGDNLYLKDYKLIQKVYKGDNKKDNYCSSGLCAYKVGTNSKTGYWLASRHYSYEMWGYFTFDVRYIDTEANLNITNHNLRIYDGHYGGGWTECTYSSHAIRPIITLKKDITILKGDGTKKKPYILK